jgi:hypothetical protein
VKEHHGYEPERTGRIMREDELNAVARLADS